MFILHILNKISEAKNFGKQNTSDSRNYSKAHKENKNKPTTITKKENNIFHVCKHYSNELTICASVHMMQPANNSSDSIPAIKLHLARMELFPCKY